MVEKSEHRISSKLRRLTGWAGFGLVVLGIVSGLSTFAILTGLTPIIPTKEVTTALLLLNTGLVVIMAAMIGGQVLFLLRERRKGHRRCRASHIRLISLFSLIAVVPAIVVAVFAFVTLNRGLDTWFSERTQAIVNSAVTVAEEYIRNTAEATRADVANISADLNQQKDLFDTDRAAFVRRVARHAALRGLAGAFVFDQSQRRIDVNVTASDKVKFLAPSPEMIAHADKGELVLIPPGEGGNLVRALIKLQSFPSHYFYVYRLISPTVIEQLTKTREAKAEYDSAFETAHRRATRLWHDVCRLWPLSFFWPRCGLASGFQTGWWPRLCVCWMRRDAWLKAILPPKSARLKASVIWKRLPVPSIS